MKFKKLLLLSILTLALAGCNENSTSTPSIDSSLEGESSSVVDTSTPVDSSSEGLPEFVDYVSSTKLNLEDTSKVYARVEVANYVDGDTTHFRPYGDVDSWPDTEDNILKARYNSCDTPESTGKVEPWGQAAKKFTRNALQTAKSIILQSDTSTWDTDTTGERYLVWVWYQPAKDADYRLLNLELVQEGLAKLKSASSYSLYDTFNAANRQSILYEKCVYSKEKDPDFYYGAAQQITCRELRENLETYADTKVSINALVTLVDSYSHMAYVQDYDDETQSWYGIDVYMGFTSYEIIEPGNYLRLVGTVAYYETGEKWQLTGLSYFRMNPDYEGSMKLLEKGLEVTPFEITSADLSSKKADGETLAPGDRLQAVYVKIENLTVYDVYTTQSTNTSSNGAMTLTCKDENGVQVIVRTSVLKHSDGTLLVKDDVLNKTITAVGIVTMYDSKVQIHVYTLNELTIA